MRRLLEKKFSKLDLVGGKKVKKEKSESEGKYKHCPICLG